MERTLIILKPDAVQRGLCGTILMRFEQRGFRIVGMKWQQVPEELARAHYAEHAGKPFFEELVAYITASPVVVMGAGRTISHRGRARDHRHYQPARRVARQHPR